MAHAKTAPKSKHVSLEDIKKQAIPMIEALTGFVAGNLAINGLTTLAGKALKIDAADTSIKAKLIKTLPPLIIGGGATYGTIKAKSPHAKSVLLGVAMAGGYKTAKALLPNASFLNGDGLGLTPVSAVSNGDRWLYQEGTPISGIGFPDLGAIQPPEGGSGYYLDAPAYFQGAEDAQIYGAEEDLNGSADDYANQLYGDDTEIL
jgi:hypothetical protein